MSQKKNIVRILIVVIIVIAVAIVATLIFRIYQDRFKEYVDRIEITYQDQNGISATNYVAILKEGVAWDETTDKEGIAKYVVKTAIKDAVDTEVRSYNIIGQSADLKVLFLYSGEKGTIILYDLEGRPEGEAVQAK